MSGCASLKPNPSTPAHQQEEPKIFDIVATDPTVGGVEPLVVATGDTVVLVAAGPIQNGTENHPYFLVSEEMGAPFRVVQVPARGSLVPDEKVSDFDAMLTRTSIDLALMYRGGVEWLTTKDLGKTWQSSALVSTLSDADRPWFVKKGDEVALVYQQIETGTWLATRSTPAMNSQRLIVPAGLIGCLCSPGRPGLAADGRLLIPFTAPAVGGNKITIAESSTASWDVFEPRDIPMSAGTVGNAGLVSLASSGNTTIVVWPGFANERAALMASRSHDGGMTWSPARPLDIGDWTGALPLVTAGENGTFQIGLVATPHHIDDARHASGDWFPALLSLTSESEDNITFTPAERPVLHHGGLMLELGDFASAAAVRGHVLVAASRDDESIVVLRSD